MINTIKILHKNINRLRFSTLDQKEMKQFDQMTDWWNPAGPMHILYKYNYHRVEFLKSHLQNTSFAQPFKDLSVLDVGCGAGFLTSSLARLGANATGLDPNTTSYG